MNRIKVLYITKSDDDAYRRLNEIPFQDDSKDVKISNYTFSLKGHNDFYFGNITTEDEESLESVFLKDNRLNTELISNIIEKIKWDKDTEVVFATHWGGKSKNEYKEYLDGIAVLSSKIKPGYWGTQADSYGSNDINRIKEDIIEFAYPNIYRPLYEAKELISSQMKFLDYITNRQLKEDIDEIEPLLKGVIDKALKKTDNQLGEKTDNVLKEFDFRLKEEIEKVLKKIDCQLKEDIDKVLKEIDCRLKQEIDKQLKEIYLSLHNAKGLIYNRKSETDYLTNLQSKEDIDKLIKEIKETCENFWEK